MAQVALIAHDAMKNAMVEFCRKHQSLLAAHRLIATGTTGSRVAAATGLQIECMLSGPLGGDAQIAARVAVGEVSAVVFLVDPLSAHPHEPDIQSLQRVCNVHNTPLATNLATGELIMRNLGA